MRYIRIVDTGDIFAQRTQLRNENLEIGFVKPYMLALKQQDWAIDIAHPGMQSLASLLSENHRRICHQFLVIGRASFLILLRFQWYYCRWLARSHSGRIDFRRRCDRQYRLRRCRSMQSRPSPDSHREGSLLSQLLWLHPLSHHRTRLGLPSVRFPIRSSSCNAIVTYPRSRKRGLDWLVQQTAFEPL